MAEPGRYWDGAGLERKISGAGRPWRVGDIAMVADGQWAVGVTASRDDAVQIVVEHRAADWRRVEMTVEELACAVGSPFRRAHRDVDPD